MPAIPGAPGQDPTRSPQTLTLVTMSVQVQDVEVSLELRPYHDLLQRQRPGSRPGSDQQTLSWDPRGTMGFKQRLSQRTVGLPADTHFHTVCVRQNTLLPGPAHHGRSLGHITGSVIPTA